MAYKPSLAPYLYVSAESPVDQRLREQMREQDLGPEPTDASKPRFTIVVGPSPFSMPRGWEFFLTSPYEGVSYIATVAHNAGFPVRIVDVRYSPDPLNDALAQIREGTDILGVATFEDNFPFTRELMAAAKAEHPHVPIIAGGSLVTSVPDTFFSQTATDVAVISEGEITILELLQAYRTGGFQRADLENIRGIWFRGDGVGEVIANEPRGQMPDLDCLPRMRLDLWPQYHSPLGLQPQIISSYSRGCKMDCSFCYRTTPLERAKSPAKLEAELKWLKERYGTEFIFFVDLTFTAHKRQTLEILEAIQSQPVRWTCLTRNSDMDAERAVAMNKANCDIALFGVESLAKGVLKTARKGSNENLTTRSMHHAWDAGIRWGGLTIVGLEGETAESLDHMAKWAETHNHITRVKYLSLMPGTTVYSQGVDRGHIRSEVDHLNWLSIEQALHEDEFINVNGLPEQVMRDAYKRIYDAYQPGPVMDFEHWPENFEFHHPNADDATPRSTDYAGPGWRKEHSSATPRLYEGSERFTLERVGAPGMAEKGASTMVSGARALEDPSPTSSSVWSGEAPAHSK